MPQIDPEDLHWFMGVKFAIVVAIFSYSPSWLLGFAIVAILAAFYRNVIAAMLGLHVMDVMDLNCFYSGDKARCNVMSATPVSVGHVHLTKESFSRIVYAHIKARSQIVKVLGDMYYKELDKEDVIKTQIEILPDGML